eukprot:9698089-Alexandrium_andersonii.AAC.1
MVSVPLTGTRRAPVPDPAALTALCAPLAAAAREPMSGDLGEVGDAGDVCVAWSQAGARAGAAGMELRSRAATAAKSVAVMPCASVSGG